MVVVRNVELHLNISYLNDVRIVDVVLEENRWSGCIHAGVAAAG